MVDVFLPKKAYNGEYYAENEKQVIDFVHRNYGYVIKIERVKNIKTFHHLFKPRLQFSNRERENFYNQLSTLLDAGIPIVKGIEMVAERLSEKYKPSCTRLNLSLQSGRPLSYAMSLQPGSFSEMNKHLQRVDGLHMSILTDSYPLGLTNIVKL